MIILEYYHDDNTQTAIEIEAETGDSMRFIMGNTSFGEGFVKEGSTWVVPRQQLHDLAIKILTMQGAKKVVCEYEA
jgi:hypothetical protein